MTGVAILGSTGTIGVNTLDVLSHHPDDYNLVALTAHSNVDRLFEQCQKFHPALVALVDQRAAALLRNKLRDANLNIDVAEGEDGVNLAATHVDVEIVMAGIVGSAGLVPTLSAVGQGKRVLLANKEPLVMLGGFIIEQARSAGATLLPIDSEHNAIFQCLPTELCAELSAGEKGRSTRSIDASGIRKILLTGSGGPFRTLAQNEFESVTLEQACAHPNWVMGPKISVDSATMMNKGLEIIEACWLFNTSPDRIRVVVHPESIIHSMVEYIDGSILAQLSSPDMRVPIAHALAWPRRVESGVASLDLFAIAQLNFEPPDPERFPCLRLAQEAIFQGGSAPAVLNAANEVAVQAFLDRRIRFTAIPELISETLEKIPVHHQIDLESILDIDAQARKFASGWIDRSKSIFPTASVKEVNRLPL